jgi:multidrug transporter EmrE-like cation transporter
MEIVNKRTPNARFWIVIRFAILICLAESFSQSTLKHNKHPSLGFLGYMIVAALLYKSYEYENLGHMNLVWSCMSIITGYIVGYLLFNETLNKYTIVSITLALIAIYTAHLSDEE